MGSYFIRIIQLLMVSFEKEVYLDKYMPSSFYNALNEKMIKNIFRNTVYFQQFCCGVLQNKIVGINLLPCVCGEVKKKMSGTNQN
jgi:hypothetical protein